MTAAFDLKIQKLEKQYADLKIEVSAEKNMTAAFDLIQKLEKQYADLKTEVSAEKDNAGKDGPDWVQLYAAGRVEVAELSSKLSITQSKLARLEIENEELRKKLAQ